MASESPDALAGWLLVDAPREDKMIACTLCSDLQSPTEVHPWNEALYESRNFVAFPSLGALIEGWLLLLPKHHYVSIGAMPASLLAEFKEFKSSVNSILSNCYGPICGFEHGPSSPGRAVGCGVDHAHFHLVPFEADLSKLASPLLPLGATWRDSELEGCQAANSQGVDYLFVEQPIGRGQIATHSQFGSQLFRRAIAGALGVPEQYNWRQHKQLATIATTILRLRSSPSHPTTRSRPGLAA